MGMGREMDGGWEGIDEEVGGIWERWGRGVKEVGSG